MISGIHLATALSVMLHMEQEGNEMNTDQLVSELEHHHQLKFMTPSSISGAPYQMVPLDLLSEAADRLLVQQHVIDELVGAMEMIAGITPCPDDLMGNVDIAQAALSLAKGHTKDAE